MLKQGFSTSAILTFGADSFSVVRRRVHCAVWSSDPDLHPPDASSTHTPKLWQPQCSRHHSLLPGTNSAPTAKPHCRGTDRTNWGGGVPFSIFWAWSPTLWLLLISLRAGQWVHCHVIPPMVAEPRSWVWFPTGAFGQLSSAGFRRREVCPCSSWSDDSLHLRWAKFTP